MAARILRWFAGALVAGLLLLVLFGLVWRQHFNPPPPRPSYRTPSSPLEAQRQDVEAFDRLIALDRAFSPQARQRAESRLAELAHLDRALDPPHLRVALMQIDALADNGHSRVSRGEDDVPSELPVRVAPFSDGLYIMRAKTEDADLLGSRIVAIEGTPVDEVMQRLESLRGGTPQWRRLYASIYLTMPDLLFGLDIAHGTTSSTWTVQTPAGKQITRTLQAYPAPRSEPYVFVKRWFSSEPLTGLTEGWSAAQPTAPLPLTLRDFDRYFRMERLPNSCVALVQMKSNANEDGEPIGEFLHEAEAKMRSAPPCNLILDLRFDDGGDYVNTYRFAKHLPDLVAPGGRILMLIGPSTFSAGITTTAFVKQASGDRVTLLGEPVGDRLHFYSEGGSGCLPNMKACVSYETGKHDYQHPCTDIADCFWLNYAFPVRVKTLDPDETIPWSFADWSAGRDPVFDRAIELAVGGRGTGVPVP